MLTPQGTLCEKIRAGGAGIPGYYTPTGAGTIIEEGGFPIKLGKDGKTLIAAPKKEKKIFDGKSYILEDAIKGDFALIKGWKADERGNVIFRKSARNFNPDCAMAGKICIVEVEEIVPTGSLDPDAVHLPDVFVKRIVKAEHLDKKIEFRTTSGSSAVDPLGKGEGRIKRERIVKRAAKEI